MKAIMLTFMLCLMLPMSSTTEFSQPTKISLSMMKKSVDDRYFSCIKEMDQKVKSTYFPREMKKNKLFQTAWNKSETCAQKKYNNRTDMALTKDHVQALCVYTEEYPKVYDPFNKVVRSSARIYNTRFFKYHALHFWLTSAIQILNVNKPCLTTYRRSKNIYSGKVTNIIRFGSFTSSSKKTNLTTFGTETCFRIMTCTGAYIKEFSKYQHEEEVLIPPYEKFKITKIETSSNLKFEDLKDCKKIFFLESAGVLSKLNCKAAHKLRKFDHN